MSQQIWEQDHLEPAAPLHAKYAIQKTILLQYVHKLETLNPNVVSVASLIKWKTVASAVGTAQVWMVQRIGARRMEKMGKLCRQPIITLKFLLMMRRLPWNS